MDNMKKLEKKWERMGISPFKILMDVLVSDLVQRKNRGSAASGLIKTPGRKCRLDNEKTFPTSSLKLKHGDKSLRANSSTNSKPSIGYSSERLSQVQSPKLLKAKVSKESSGNKDKKEEKPKVSRRKSIVRKGRNLFLSNDRTKAKQSAMTFVITELESNEYATNGNEMNSTDKLESQVYLPPKEKTESKNSYQLDEIDERAYVNGSNFGTDQYEDSNDIDDSNCSELNDEIWNFVDDIGDVFFSDNDELQERMNESRTTDINKDIAKNI